jgi:hypothetical protein
MHRELDMERKIYSNNIDYTLHFDSIQNSNGLVRLVDHIKEKESRIGLTVDDQDFRFRIQEELPSIIADLIDLAVAIHASDRLVFQHLRREQTRICVVLPVRHPELLNAKVFYSKLENLLEWATGSRWFFDFQKRADTERNIEMQSLLFPSAPQTDQVLLWSGGLDALAGLYLQLQEYPEKMFVLFGTGSNENVYALQELLAKHIQEIFPGRCSLYRIPIRFQGSNRYRKNKITRARGLVFTMLGSACAYLMGQKKLYVYENGIGAINLPYRKSAVGLDHSRSVHPLTLMMVSDLISELLGEPFQIRNPFLFSTKAEMCHSLARDGKFKLASLSKSCDSPHRKQPEQCGYCSSCLLRRQALAASKIQDKTRYVILHGKQPVAEPSISLRHMLEQVKTLQSLLDTSNSLETQWEALTRRYYVLDDIVDKGVEAENLSITEMRSRLIQLYQSYVDEWEDVESTLSVGLLNQKDQPSSGKQWSVA